MKIIEPHVELINAPDYKTLLTTIEAAGRTCYKSEDKITDGSAEKFVRGIIKRGHEAVIEHDRLIQYYQMPDDYTWLCKEMLKRIGVDVEAWNKERKEPDETEKH